MNPMQSPNTGVGKATGEITGWICSAPIYDFGGWLFEFHSNSGPWPLRKDLEPRKKAGDIFYSVFSDWYDLGEKKREKYRIGGGCQRF